MKRFDRTAAGCEGKTGFSHSEAHRIAKGMRRHDLGVVQAYHCETCGWWHIGNHIAKIPDKRREVKRAKNEKQEWQHGDEAT